MTAAKLKPKGAGAVMASRKEPPAALDFFPTPPWATRALCEHVLGRPRGLDCRHQSRCWEPAAGEGHMAVTLSDYFANVYASDVFDYGKGHTVGSFTGEGVDVAQCPFEPDWIITNPPFNQAQAFVERALRVARYGVAVLVRTTWLESAGRYAELFKDAPPSIVALFVERVPMVKGRWDPEASTATSYAWVIWSGLSNRKVGEQRTRLVWIPPGCRTELDLPQDRRRFLGDVASDLFEVTA